MVQTVILLDFTRFYRGGLLRYLRVVGDAVALGNIFGAPIEEVRFARDSPLEEDGFELSVPR